jgi:hypothetical protein
MLADFAGAGNTAAVRLMLDLGFDAGRARTSPTGLPAKRHSTSRHRMAGSPWRDC